MVLWISPRAVASRDVARPDTPTPLLPRPLPPRPFLKNRWLLGALLLTSAAVALPFFAGVYLPFLDLPQHVGAVAILRGGPEALGLDTYYEIDLLSSPYLLPYLLAAGLARLVGPLHAIRLMFVLAAVLLPWSVAFATRAFGRDPRIAPLAAPLALGTFTYMGFLNFVLALPLLLFYLGWWRRACTGRDFGWRRWLMGGLWGVLLFYGHVLILGFALGAAGLVALLAHAPNAPPWRRRLPRLAHLLPALGLVLAWLLLSPVASRGELGRMIGGGMASEHPVWSAPADTFRGIFDFFLSVFPDRSDEALALALPLLFGLFALLRRRPQATAGGESAGLRAKLSEGLPALLTLSALALLFLLPSSYRGIWPIGARMVPVAALLLLLVPRGKLLLPRLTLLLGVALAAATGLVHARHVAAFQAEVGGLDEAIAPIRPGSRVMTLIFDRGSRVVRQPAFLHFGQYALAEKGGVAEFSFVNFTKSPIHYRPRQAPPRLPARFEWTPERFDYTRQGRYFDYFLVRDGGRDRKARIFRQNADELRQVVRAGPWVLYRRLPASAL